MPGPGAAIRLTVPPLLFDFTESCLVKYEQVELEQLVLDSRAQPATKPVGVPAMLQGRIWHVDDYMEMNDSSNW